MTANSRIPPVSKSAEGPTLLRRVSDTAAKSRVGFAVLVTVAAIPLALAIAVGAYELARIISGPTQYPELIVGALSIYGGDKSGDAALVFAFWIVIGLAAGLAYSRGSTLEKRARLVPLALVLLSFSAAFLVMTFSRGLAPIVTWYSPVWMLALAQLLAIMAFVVRRIVGKLSPSQTNRVAISENLPAELAWLCVSSLAFVPAAGLVVAARYLTLISSTNKVVLALIFLVVSGVIVVAITTLLSLVRSTRITGHGFMVPITSLLGIASLPLLLPPLLTIDGVSVVVPGMLESRWLIVLIAVALAIAAETLIRRRFAHRTQRWVSGYSSIAIAALIVPLRLSVSAPNASPLDNYHFGELFTPAYLFLSQELTGSVPMARGPLVNLFPQLLNNVLFSGTASTFFYTLPLLLLMILALSHSVLRFSVGMVAATAIVVSFGFANSFTEGDFAAWVVVLFAVDLIRRDKYPALRGVIIALALAGAIILYPLMGLAGGLIAVVLMVVKLAGALISRDGAESRRQGLVAATVAIVSILLFVVDPASGLRGSIGYVIGQAQGAILAHGSPIGTFLPTRFTDSFFVTFAFGVAVVISAWTMWVKRSWLLKPSARTWFSYALLVVPAVAAIGLSSRFLGRITEANFAVRPLNGSLLILVLILPVCVLLADPKAFRRLALASLAAGLVISFSAIPLFRGGIPNAVTGIYHSGGWASAPYLEAIPALGLGDADPKQLEELRQINTVSQRISNTLTIQNLSNRNSLNVFFNWPNTGEYLAPYNIADRKTEARYVSALDAAKPDALFIGPAMWFDGLSMSLRSPLLADWVVRNYIPVACPGSSWAFSSSLDAPAIAALLPSDCVLGSQPEVARDLWARTIGAPTNLLFLPHSWGSTNEGLVPRGAVALRDEISSEQELRFVADIPLGMQPPAEYLRIDGACDGLDPLVAVEFGSERASSQATLTWTRTGSTTPNVVSTFEWGNGSFLVPLGAYPEWSLPPSSGGQLAIIPPASSCPSAWSVSAEFVADRP